MSSIHGRGGRYALPGLLVCAPLAIGLVRARLPGGAPAVEVGRCEIGPELDQTPTLAGFDRSPRACEEVAAPRSGRTDEAGREDAVSGVPVTCAADPALLEVLLERLAAGEEQIDDVAPTLRILAGSPARISELLRDVDRGRRALGASLLGAMATYAATDALIEAFPRERDEGVREAMLAALSCQDDPRTLALLMEAWIDAHAPAAIRRAALQGLARLGAPAVRAELRRSDLEAEDRRLVEAGLTHALSRPGADDDLVRIVAELQRSGSDPSARAEAREAIQAWRSRMEEEAERPR